MAGCVALKKNSNKRSYDVEWCELTQRKSKNASKQNKMLISIHPDDEEFHLTPSLESSHISLSGEYILFIDGGNPGNPKIDPVSLLCDLKEKEVTVLPVSCLKIPLYHIDDHHRGLIYRSLDGPSKIIIVPRLDTLEKCSFFNQPRMSISLCEALDAVESNVPLSVKRGLARHVVQEKSHKYFCIGPQTRHAVLRGVEVLHSVLRKTDLPTSST